MKFRPNADIWASVLVHLSVLALIFLFSEVHQFDPVAADTMPVEVVTPQEAAEVAPEPVPTPSPTPEFQLPSLDKPVEQAKSEAKTEAKSELPTQAPAPQPSPQPQQKQATPPTPKPSPSPSPQPPQHAAAAEPPAPPPSPQQPSPQAAPPPSQPAYAAPQPDLTVKYNVMLGLPPDISAPAPSAAPHSADLGGADNFDAPAIEEAKVGSSVVGEFRRHLKTCLKLPSAVKSGDDVRVKLRVLMTPDGKLAAPPQLVEATASEKGPLLIQSATSALKACQPYAMLPKDRYGEWKVLDLDFTPRDFAS